MRLFLKDRKNPRAHPKESIFLSENSFLELVKSKEPFTKAVKCSTQKVFLKMSENLEYFFKM